MEPNPTFLDKKAARVARSVLSALRDGDASPMQSRLARAALRYYVAPWDLIPDMIPGIGIIDDYLVLIVAAAAIGAKPDSGEVDPNEVALEIRAELARKPAE